VNYRLDNTGSVAYLMDGTESRNAKFEGGAIVPLGALKCSTFPSSLNMLTSSTPGMGWTLSFFKAPCSFLSSWAPDGLAFLTTFRRTVPFPPDGARN